MEAKDRKTSMEELKKWGEEFTLADHGEREEIDQTTKELKSFHKSFYLCLGNSGHNGNAKSSSVSSPGIRVEPRGFGRKKKRRPWIPPAGFNDVYELTGEILGCGALSTVRSCRHRATGKEFAVKIVTKTHGHIRERVLKEVEILYHSRRNRYILELVESFEDTDKFYLVFEKMEGGPLLSHIRSREHFTEREASEVVREVASALTYLHSIGIAHRDLKPENVLCKRRDQVIPVKICDFDLSSMAASTSLTPNSTTPTLLTPVGSAEFMAPEVVETFLGTSFSYDKKCDLWSLGVMLFMMLSGRPPFYGHCGGNCGWTRGEACDKCQDQLLARIKSGQYAFSEKVWQDVSPDAKDLIGRLLVREPRRRFSAEEVLSHPWLGRGTPDTPLLTPGILSRNPSTTNDLSSYAASCLQFKRQLSSQMAADDSVGPGDGVVSTRDHAPFSLSPPGSSELATRRAGSEEKSCSSLAAP